MMRRLLSVTGVIALVMQIAPGCVRPATTDAADSTDVEPYGVCSHLTWRWFYKTDDEVRRALIMMKEAGVQWARIGLEWNAIEPEEGKPDPNQWARIDLVVTEARRLKIRPYFLMIGTPRWASPKPDDEEYWTYAPKDLAVWERFVRAAAARYRGKIHFWEVNNEIDWVMFWKSGLPAYVEYLKVASKVLKRTDPQNRVILAGLATDGVHSFEHAGLTAEENVLQRLYDLGAGPYFDVVALHPYSHKVDGAEISVAKVETAYSVMRRNGDADKPIWCNEIGLSTKHNPPWSDFTEEDQAQALVDVYPKLLSMKQVEKVFWYNFRCKGTDPRDHEHNYGIVNNDMSPRKAYHAYARMTKADVPTENGEKKVQQDAPAGR